MSTVSHVPPPSAQRYLRVYEKTADFAVAREALYRFSVMAAGQVLKETLPAENDPKMVLQHMSSFIDFSKELLPVSEADKKKCANNAAYDEYASTRRRIVAELQKCNPQSALQYKQVLVPRLNELVKKWSAMRETILPIRQLAE